MTDKELKDYCKTCNVEPPAMKFKCPECEHNPDKEQIIIDGCNVLKCRYYQYKTLKDCEMRYPESGDCEIGLINYLFNGNLDMEKLCVDNPNCYFKQLARKTQECEQKDERIIELTKECQRLKEQKNKADKTISDLIGCVSLWEEFTEEESKLAKDSSIADLVMLLRERTQDYKNYKKQVEEFYKYMDE